MRRPLVWMAVPVCVYSVFGAVLHINFLILFFTSLAVFVIIHLIFSRLSGSSENIFQSLSAKKNSVFYEKQGTAFQTNRSIAFMAVFSIIALTVISFNSKENIIVKGLSEKGIQAEASGRVKKINIYDDRMYVQIADVKVNAAGVSSHLNGVLLKAPSDDAGIGDILTVKGTLQKFDVAKNEGCFDEKSYYGSIGIEAVLDTKTEPVISHTKNIFYKAADGVRRHFKDSFEKVSPDHKGELSSVILGDKSELDPDIKELYSENGIAHILAISGLHISFAGLGIYKILRRTGLDLVSSTLTSGVIVVCYVLLTGSSISAWRACVMFLMAAAAEILGRSYDPLSALSAQGMVTLLVTPKAVTGASFIMSYTAVLAIILANEAFGNVLYRLKGNLTILRIILSDIISAGFVFVFMLPVNLYFYHYVPVYSMFLNMIVIPLSSVLMPLGMCAGFLGRINAGVGIFFAGGAERIFDIYSFSCRTLQNIPFNRLYPGTPGVLLILLFYSFFAWCFIVWKLRVEKDLKAKLGEPGCDIKDIFRFFRDRISVLLLGIAPLLTVLLLTLKTKKQGFFVSMLYVGQGDCILVHTDDGKNLLFDGGSSNINNVYKKQIKPFLLSRGINKIDMILVSHTDADHVNGITELLNECDGKNGNKGNIKVSSLIMPSVGDEIKDELYRELTNSAYEKGIAVTYSSKGTQINGGTFSLSCLSPGVDDFSTDKNGMSAVYRFETDGLSMLFTGDMTEESERRLLAENAFVKADILKTAHHGSNYSSCSEFLEAVSPKAGIISCGVNNYGHPGTETMERFERLGIPTLVTKECGQIFIERKGKNIFVRTLLNDSKSVSGGRTY